MAKLVPAVAALVALAWLSSPRPASATLAMQKKAKDLGLQPASEGCLHCHGEKLPKKGAVTNNARGQWLVAEKERRKAKDFDMSWLKDYKEESEKK
jgi:mono/diheme cytochrome c family protein